MGKAKAGGDAEQAVPSTAPATSSGGFNHRRCAAAVGKVLNAKCAALLLLAVGGFLSALFLLLHLRTPEVTPDDPDILAEIKAGFILLSPHSELASHARTLEKEIYDQLGVPNSKVSVSMHPYTHANSTYVTFGILPDPRNTSISQESMSTLRKSLIKLTLQQLNLSLTPAVFGHPRCLEILGFPGGVTLLLPRNDFHQNPIQPMFNITLNLTIHQARESIDPMRAELQSILQMTRDEVLWVELTNTNGSTVATPVTVQVSLSTNDHSNFVQPNRLRQLAQIIAEWHTRNLGLNTSIFGRIEDLTLSPLLQGMTGMYAPSLSTAPLPSIAWPPSSDDPRINTYGFRHFSCPGWLPKQNEIIPHREV